jgi:hypothetical protein
LLHRKLVGKLNYIFYSIYVTVTDFPLKYCFILDSSFSIHVSRTLNRFTNSEKHQPVTAPYAVVELFLSWDTAKLMFSSLVFDYKFDDNGFLLRHRVVHGDLQPPSNMQIYANALAMRA